MSNTDTRALTGRPPRRLAGAPGRTREHTGRTHARPSRPPAPRAVTTAVEPTLLDIFDATASTWGTRPAIDAPRGVLTYNDLAQEVRELADRLRDGGVGRGDRVGIRVPSGKADLYVAILGALAAGAAYVPVDADDPVARAEQIFADAAVCVVVGEGLELSWRSPAGGQPGRPTADDDAWIIFTSGSTGAPKGVAVTHRAAAAFVEAEEELWQVRPEDRVLAGLSVAFDASCEEMWLAWAHGAALVPAPRALVRSGVELGPWLWRASGTTTRWPRSGCSSSAVRPARITWWSDWPMAASCGTPTARPRRRSSPPRSVWSRVSR
jgi:non-ribosomal peptide synthetase component F